MKGLSKGRYDETFAGEDVRKRAIYINEQRSLGHFQQMCSGIVLSDSITEEAIIGSLYRRRN